MTEEEVKPLLIGEKKIPFQVLQKKVSTSGKYNIFYGTHVVEGRFCYDVAAMNTITGELIRRHYKAKDEAITYWDEFQEKMLAPAQEGEEDEPGPRIWEN